MRVGSGWNTLGIIAAVDLVFVLMKCLSTNFIPRDTEKELLLTNTINSSAFHSVN